MILFGHKAGAGFTPGVASLSARTMQTARIDSKMVKAIEGEKRGQTELVVEDCTKCLLPAPRGQELRCAGA